MLRQRTSLVVPLLTDETANNSGCQPVTIGLPFPKGKLKNPGSLTIQESNGRQRTLQAQALRRWSDGSVQWLLLDFILDSAGKSKNPWLLCSDSPEQDTGDRTMRVIESENNIVIDTGDATFHIGRSTFPFDRVVIDGKDVLQPNSGRTTITDAQGRVGIPQINSVTLECRGPVRATVRYDGEFTGRARCRFSARCSFFAGTGLVRISQTIHNPKRAKHRGNLWDLGDSGSMLFRDLSTEFRLLPSGETTIGWKAEFDQQPQRLTSQLEIYQDSSGGENWNSANHVNRHGKIPCRFRGYRVCTSDGNESGYRATPVVNLQSNVGSLSAAVPEFWQQFPKAIEAEGNTLRIRLFPEQFGDLHELQGGEKKTHTYWLNFGAPGKTALHSLDWVHQPTRLHASPEWYAASGVFPHLTPSHSTVDNWDEYCRDVVGGKTSLFARREIIDEFGWRNYGEVYADHEGEHYDGTGPVISHYNNQYDLIEGMLLQFVRTGDVRWFDLFDPLARHAAEIDIYWTDQDRAAYNGGMFWFTDHYKTAATCAHRTYSKSNCRPGDRSYGGGPSSNHNFTTGLLYHYYLTGDENSRDAVLSLANWVIDMDDGRKTIFGLWDDGYTGLASCTGSPDYHGPGRGSGNSINALLDGWLLTDRKHYLDKAEQLIRRSVHPGDDIEQRELLNVEKRWSYTVFFTVIDRYLRLKAQANQLDFMYAYAQSSLVHYAKWMLDNEVPYLDYPENLEFVTEAWPAQEMRKANVLRLASAHADEPLRSKLLEKGQEFADRARKDLQRFDTCRSARAIAILLQEGVRDAYLQLQSLKLSSRPPKAHQFVDAEEFVHQKANVLAQLKSVQGLLCTFLILINPTNWPQLLSGFYRR